MSQWYMLTIPRSATSKKQLRLIFDECDVKKYIIAKEKGKNGYEHYQIRVESSRPDFFDYVHDRIPQSHIMKAETDSFDYERKEGHFWTSEDNPEILKVRFGKPNKLQKKILKELMKQSDRGIDVWYDPQGSHGKSWLSIHLWEHGKALVVPRYACTPEKLSAFVCSAYRGEPIIIIDIPRARKPTEELYEAMEELKDGLVFDPRYQGRTRNIRGAKILVFTNHKLNLKLLSYDRWNLHTAK